MLQNYSLTRKVSAGHLVVQPVMVLCAKRTGDRQLGSE